MHSVDPPRGVFDDTVYLMTIHLRRVDDRELNENYKMLEAQLPNRPDRDWQLWMARTHDGIDAFDGAEYTNYRYDVPCPRNQRITIDVELRNIKIGETSFKREDDATIRRILKSVKCTSISR